LSVAANFPHPNPGGSEAGERRGERQATLVVEIVVEELPPKALKSLGTAFADTLVAELRRRNVLTEASVATPYATPRRLAVAVTGVRSAAADAVAIDRLMPATIARDAPGAPSEALRKKLSSLGRGHIAAFDVDTADSEDRLYVSSDGKAEYAYLRRLVQGMPLERALRESLDVAIARLPVPKLMRYPAAGSYYNDVEFVRPAHRLVALHGRDVVPVTALGLAAGRISAGHRFLARSDLAIGAADAYAPTLEAEGKVLPSFDGRREVIVRALQAAAHEATVIMPDALLDEVTALVEWPAVYEGAFDPAFLAVPQECLILTMQQNQKYFALADAHGKLIHRFLLVSNIASEDASAIIRGNERVLRARLADAKFFYDQDRRQPLASRVERLRGIVYHNKLGTLHDRVERLRFLARNIGPRIGAAHALADRAALLAKADLVTDMVAEFPELQGTMGGYYALHDGEAAGVADAIAQHYWPRHAGDALPDAPIAQAVALADFLYERLRGHLREQGYTANQVEAVLVQRPQRIDLVPEQLAAVKAFEALPEAAALSAANKRIVNILKKSGIDVASSVNVERLTQGAERDLWQSFEALAPEVDRHCARTALRC
jgi:glycyl-tRNA synthetase beta chain